MRMRAPPAQGGVRSSLSGLSILALSGRCDKGHSAAGSRRRLRTAGLPVGSVMDAVSEVGQPLTAAAPAAGDDLGGDADGGLLGGPRAEVETDGRGEPLQLR